MRSLGPLELLLVLLITGAVIAIIVIPVWRIIEKVGYSGWWSLLYLVPFATIVMLYVFAFADWPVLRRLRAFQQGQPQYDPRQQYQPPGSYYPPPGDRY